MTDPKVALKGLLEEGWALDFKPAFSTDWYDAGSRLPQVVVSQVYTQPRRLGFSEEPSAARRRFEASYAVDVWSPGDQERRWRMTREVDRIIQARCDSPGGGMEFAEVSGWRDLDEGSAHPRLYRSRVTVNVLYYS